MSSFFSSLSIVIADTHMTFEDITSTASFAVLFLLWTTIVFLAWRRTIKWDFISVALTVVIGLQGLREVWGLGMTTGWWDVPDNFKLFIRYSMIVTAVMTIYSVGRDRPAPPEFLRRRWTDKYMMSTGEINEERLYTEMGESLRHTVKSLEDIAFLLESLSLGPLPREDYAKLASKVRRHANKAGKLLEPPVHTNMPQEIDNIQIPSGADKS